MVLNFDEARDGSEEDETEMVDLFVLDGETYQMPAKPKMNAALRFLDTARKRGHDVAIVDMLERVLGTETYNALLNYDDLTNDQFNQVVSEVQKRVMGATERGKEKPSNG